MTPGTRVLAVVGVAAWALSSAAQEAPPGAAERVRMTLAAAATASPALLAELAERDRAAAEVRAGAAVDSAALEWQREGIGGASGRRPNAQDVLRVARPVRYPWQGSAARSVRSASERWQLEGRRGAQWRVLSEIASRWLEAAALSDRVAVVEQRWRRLDEALSLQEARYQLGEVSGSDVTQLDLEHVRESSRLASLRAEREAVVAGLRELVGGDLGEPRAGDLVDLAGSTRHPESPTAAEVASQAGPLAAELRADSEMISARGRLEARDAGGWPELELEWERIPTIAGVSGFDAWGLRIAVPLPFDRGVRERRAAGEAAASAAERRLAARRAELAARTAAALARARGAEERLVALRPALGTLAEAAHSLAEQFRLGTLSYLVYIDGMSRLDDIRLEAVDARLELMSARLELATLLGDGAAFPLPAAVLAGGADADEEDS